MWTVKFHEEFEAEFDKLAVEVQDEFFAEARFVKKFGRRRAGRTSTR